MTPRPFLSERPATSGTLRARSSLSTQRTVSRHNDKRVAGVAGQRLREQLGSGVFSSRGGPCSSIRSGTGYSCGTRATSTATRRASACRRPGIGLLAGGIARPGDEGAGSALSLLRGDAGAPELQRRPRPAAEPGRSSGPVKRGGVLLALQSGEGDAQRRRVPGPADPDPRVGAEGADRSVALAASRRKADAEEDLINQPSKLPSVARSHSRSLRKMN